MVPVLDPVIVPVREPVIVPVREARDPVIVPAEADDTTAKVNNAASKVDFRDFISFLLVNFSFAGKLAGSGLLLIEGGGSIRPTFQVAISSFALSIHVP
jgi:hypothetical protein